MDAFQQQSSNQSSTLDDSAAQWPRQRITTPSVGHLEMMVDHAKLLLLGHSLTSMDSEMKKFEWKVVIACDRGSTETKGSIMTREAQKSPYRWLPEAAKSADAYFPLHEIHWNEKLNIENVHDIWSDICIDILWRKTANPEKAGKGSWLSEASMSPRAAPVDLSPREAIKDEPPFVPLSLSVKEDISVSTPGVISTGSKPPMRNDANPARRKPPPTGEWKIYGRAIVPLASFLSSYGGTGRDLSKSLACALYCMPTDGDSGSFWVHLFPHESNERKYYKPVAGYPGFGMSNPETTLGFLHVGVRFSFTCLPIIAPVMSTFNAPTRRWVNSFSFEPQVRFV